MGTNISITFDEICETIKKNLFMNGTEAIDDFLGYEHDVNENKDVTDSRIEEVLSQMPQEEIMMYYKKYVK